jgi:hypothetical protein
MGKREGVRVAAPAASGPSSNRRVAGKKAEAVSRQPN